MRFRRKEGAPRVWSFFRLISSGFVTVHIRYPSIGTFVFVFIGVLSHFACISSRFLVRSPIVVLMFQFKFYPSLQMSKHWHIPPLPIVCFMLNNNLNN